MLPASDPMYKFILSGVKEGFHITDISEIKHPAEVDNYSSATGTNIRDKVEAQIKLEIANHRYRVVTDKPVIVSALGAIPKKHSQEVRLIHDCSRPSGLSLNDYCTNDPFKYQSLQDAVDLIKPGYYMAKLDLASAYRSVRVHESNFPATGLKWTFSGDTEPTYIVDTRLPFGARASPGIFHQLSQAVRRIMSHANINSIVVYLDDFLVIGQSKEQCNDFLLQLIQLLRYLGFSINYNKVLGPVQRLTFLGITLDSNTMTLELPDDKLQELQNTLSTIVAKKKATKKQLQSIAGKLSWATQVIYGGRFHLRRILNAIIPLRSAWHRTRITKDIREDVNWWLQFMYAFNGKTDMVDARPTTPVYIDSCPVAAGAVYGNQYVYTPWNWWPGTNQLHINFKEALALETAAAFWAPLWKNKKVWVFCDNQAAVGMINKGSCKNPFVMASLRRVFWYSATFNFRLKAIYLPGRFNTVADFVSRLHEYST